MYASIYQRMQGYDPSDIDAGVEAALSRMLGGGVSFDVRTGQPTVENQRLERTPFASVPGLSPEFTQKYFKDSVAAPLLRTFDEQIAPRVASAFAGQGATFSSRRGIEKSRQLDNLNQTMAAQLADAVRQDQLVQFQAQQQMAQQQNQLNYGYDTAQFGANVDNARFNAQLAANADQWQQALRAQLAEGAATRQQQAIAQGQQFAQQPLNRAAILQQMLQPYQQNAQDMQAARYNEFLRTRPENSPWTPLGLTFAGQRYNGMYMQQSHSPLGQIAGLAGMGLGALGGFAVGGPGGALMGAGIGSTIGGSIGGLAGGTVSPVDAGLGMGSAALAQQTYDWSGRSNQWQGVPFVYPQMRGVP